MSEELRIENAQLTVECLSLKATIVILQDKLGRATENLESWREAYLKLQNEEHHSKKDLRRLKAAQQETVKWRHKAHHEEERRRQDEKDLLRLYRRVEHLERSMEFIHNKQSPGDSQ